MDLSQFRSFNFPNHSETLYFETLHLRMLCRSFPLLKHVKQITGLFWAQSPPGGNVDLEIDCSYFFRNMRIFT